MALRGAWLLLVVWFFGVIGAMCACADPAAPASPERIVDPGSPEGEAIVRPAVDALAAKLGKPARLDVILVRVTGDWAFIYASIQGADGEPIDYAGTPYAEAAAHHAKSRSYAGLLRRNGTGWEVTDQAIGPTDPAWMAWPQQYDVPGTLVAVPSS